jgi:undecaprenyl diphosphate synthase
MPKPRHVDIMHRAAPSHVACIMDGNGRWATARGLQRIDGHEAGEAAIVSVVDAAREVGLEWLTLFAFSTENWGRPEAEVAFLMEFNRRLIARHGDRYHRQGVRIRYIGRRGPEVPSQLLADMIEIEDRTRENPGLTLTFAFNFGGRAEIVDACKRLMGKQVNPEHVTEALFSSQLQFPDMPDPDLIIRTAGEQRLSNFLLWGAAYAELLFLDVYWPDVRGQDLLEALHVYNGRTRTFGTVWE